MKPVPPQSLSSLLSALAGQVIPIQERLDRQWIKDCAEHDARGRRVGVEQHSILAGVHQNLAPRRMVADCLEFSLVIRLKQEKSVGFELKATPINLGFALTHHESVETSTRVRLTVEPVPLPAESA